MSTTNHLTVADVQRILGEARAARTGEPYRPLSRHAVYKYIERHHHGRNPGRANAEKYRANPFPAPVKPTPTSLIWVPGPGQTLAQLEDEFRSWYRDTPGQGAGGGKQVTTQCPCGCGEVVGKGGVCAKELRRRTRAAAKTSAKAGAQ